MIAKESIHNAAREPGKRLVSSRDVGWESLLVHKVESPALVESHETVPTQDQAVTVVLAGRSIIESASSGKWKVANQSPERRNLGAASRGQASMEDRVVVPSRHGASLHSVV